MKYTGTLFALLILLALMLGIWWLWEYRSIPTWKAEELTVEKKALLNKAWKKHGYFTTIETPEGCWIQRGDGKIWVWRRL